MPSQKCATESTFHRIHERLNLSENIPPQSLTIDFSTSTPQRCAGPLVIPLHRPCHRIFPISQVFLRTLVKKSLSKQQNFYCVMSIQILWLASWFPHALITKLQVFLWWWSCLKELWPFPVASHGCGTVTMGFPIEKSVKAVNAAFEMSVCNRNACLTQGRRSKIRGLEKLVVSNNVSKWGRDDVHAGSACLPSFADNSLLQWLVKTHSPETDAASTKSTGWFCQTSKAQVIPGCLIWRSDCDHMCLESHACHIK